VLMGCRLKIGLNLKNRKFVIYIDERKRCVICRELSFGAIRDKAAIAPYGLDCKLSVARVKIF